MRFISCLFRPTRLGITAYCLVRASCVFWAERCSSGIVFPEGGKSFSRNHLTVNFLRVHQIYRSKDDEAPERFCHDFQLLTCLFPLPGKENRTGDVYGRICPDNNSDNHGKGKIMYNLAAKNKESDNSNHSQSGCKNSTA